MAHQGRYSTRDIMAQVADADQQQQQDTSARQQQAHQEQMVSLDAVKRPLSAPVQATLVQGYLLKRSENLRIWNQRWFTLDPTTAKMEYRLQRTDLYPRGTILFQADSTITVSPINFHGAKQYDGCCFYIGTAGKKEYFLAAETPAAARAWVNTLRMSGVVLKAHREAMEAQGGAPSKASIKALSTATANARAAAAEASKEIAEANQRSVLAAAAQTSSSGSGAGLMNPFSLGSFSILPSSSPPPTQPLSRNLSAQPDSSGLTVSEGESISSGVHGTEGGHESQSKDSSGRVDSGESESLAKPSTTEQSREVVSAFKASLVEKDEEIKELQELLHMKDESLDKMRVSLEEAAAAADKAADAALHLGRERDRVREEAARLWSDLEKHLARKDREIAAATADRERANTTVEQAKAEIHRLRAALGAVAPALLEALGPSLCEEKQGPVLLATPAPLPSSASAPSNSSPLELEVAKSFGAGSHIATLAVCAAASVLETEDLTPQCSREGTARVTAPAPQDLNTEDFTPLLSQIAPPPPLGSAAESGSDYLSASDNDNTDFLSMLPTPPSDRPATTAGPSTSLTPPSQWAGNVGTTGSGMSGADVPSLGGTDSGGMSLSAAAGSPTSLDLPSVPQGWDVKEDPPAGSGTSHMSDFHLPNSAAFAQALGESPAGAGLGDIKSGIVSSTSWNDAVPETEERPTGDAMSQVPDLFGSSAGSQSTPAASVAPLASDGPSSQAEAMADRKPQSDAAVSAEAAIVSKAVQVAKEEPATGDSVPKDVDGPDSQPTSGPPPSLMP